MIVYIYKGNMQFWTHTHTHTHTNCKIVEKVLKKYMLKKQHNLGLNNISMNYHRYSIKYVWYPPSSM